jgi:hypothetical protein
MSKENFGSDLKVSNTWLASRDNGVQISIDGNQCLASVWSLGKRYPLTIKHARDFCPTDPDWVRTIHFHVNLCMSYHCYRSNERVVFSSLPRSLPQRKASYAYCANDNSLARYEGLMVLDAVDDLLLFEGCGPARRSGLWTCVHTDPPEQLTRTKVPVMMPGNGLGTPACFSVDGMMVALSGKSTLRVFDTAVGKCIWSAVDDACSGLAAASDDPRHFCILRLSGLGASRTNVLDTRTKSIVPMAEMRGVRVPLRILQGTSTGRMLIWTTNPAPDMAMHIASLDAKHHLKDHSFAGLDFDFENTAVTSSSTNIDCYTLFPTTRRSGFTILNSNMTVRKWHMAL